MDTRLIEGGEMLSHTTIPSPFGNIVAVANDDAVTALYVDEAPRGDIGEELRSDGNGPLGTLRDELERYWQGEPVRFDEVPLQPRGTPFQIAVWKAMKEIPYGSTISYGELARRIGRPPAVRAVGRASGANPIPIVIPCHRVIGGKGSLVGYAGGLERKRKLLLLERALAGTETQSASSARLGEVQLEVGMAGEVVGSIDGLGDHARR
jgi:methylated-DNA-[protein]-cysteine S-methyltransferase